MAFLRRFFRRRLPNNLPNAIFGCLEQTLHSGTARVSRLATQTAGVGEGTDEAIT